MKRCTKCKKRKDESEFGKERKSKDGLAHWCKKCSCERSRRQYRKIRGSVKKYLRYEERHQVIDGVKQKRCSKCKKWKAESDFYKTRQHKDGLAVSCKECANKATNKARKKRLAIRN